MINMVKINSSVPHLKSTFFNLSNFKHFVPNLLYERSIQDKVLLDKYNKSIQR